MANKIIYLSHKSDLSRKIANKCPQFYDKVRPKTALSTTPRNRPLKEVHIERCLIDLVAVDPVTKRTLGRPWLTALVDGATRAIVGAHVSF